MAGHTDTKRIGNAWGIAARVLAAVPLNYALTTAITACLARFLPMDPAQASTASTLASFAVFACLALICFSVRSVPRLWGGIVAAILAFGGLAWVSIIAGGRL